MDTAGPRPAAGVAPSTKWSAYAGGYAFLCGTATLRLLSPLSGVLVEILGLPAGVPAVVLAGPVAGIGGAVWWALVDDGARTRTDAAGPPAW
jgi:hypothetical protein